MDSTSTNESSGISIHALHEESDPTTDSMIVKAAISIHALHEESDHPRPCIRCRPADFNPRSP